MTTKDRIVDEALKLFSIKGYEGVSVRDISRAVGIKESSLYNHFKNKQDIFDTIVEVCFAKANTYFDEQSLPFDHEDDISIYRNIDVKQITELVGKTFSYFFDDPYNVMFRKLLTISQYENPRSREVYQMLYKDYPIEFQSRIFQMLMDAGEFRREDPAAVAREFYGVIFMLIHTCDSFDEAGPLVEQHVQQFIKNYHV